jgi:hypothetical protein
MMRLASNSIEVSFHQQTTTTKIKREDEMRRAKQKIGVTNLSISGKQGPG